MVATLQAGTQILPFNWTSGRLKFEQLTVPPPMYNGRICVPACSVATISTLCGTKFDSESKPGDIVVLE
jgi:hypothetical protein